MSGMQLWALCSLAAPERSWQKGTQRGPDTSLPMEQPRPEWRQHPNGKQTITIHSENARPVPAHVRKGSGPRCLAPKLQCCRHCKLVAVDKYVNDFMSGMQGACGFQRCSTLDTCSSKLFKHTTRDAATSNSTYKAASTSHCMLSRQRTKRTKTRLQRVRANNTAPACFRRHV